MQFVLIHCDIQLFKGLLYNAYKEALNISLVIILLILSLLLLKILSISESFYIFSTIIIRINSHLNNSSHIQYGLIPS